MELLTGLWLEQEPVCKEPCMYDMLIDSAGIDSEASIESLPVSRWLWSSSSSLILAGGLRFDCVWDFSCRQLFRGYFLTKSFLRLITKELP